MENLNIYITDSSDKEIQYLDFNSAIAGSATTELTLRLHNESGSNTTVNLLTAVRADMLASAPSGEDSELSFVMGQELVSESWFEARVGTSGAWTALNAWASKLDLGAIADGDYTTFQVRLNVPSDAETFGTMAFCLGVNSL